MSKLDPWHYKEDDDEACTCGAVDELSHAAWCKAKTDDLQGKAREAVNQPPNTILGDNTNG